MVARRLRTRSWRRVWKRIPGGKTVVHFERRKPSHAKCSKCEGRLSGVPRELPYKMRNLAKTKKRPERAYGGVLCTVCAREKIVKAALNLEE